MIEEKTTKPTKAPVKAAGPGTTTTTETPREIRKADPDTRLRAAKTRLAAAQDAGDMDAANTAEREVDAIRKELGDAEPAGEK